MTGNLKNNIRNENGEVRKRQIMEYYAYYSESHELRDDFTDDFILYIEAYYPGYGRIFENTAENTISIIRSRGKENIQLNAAEEAQIKEKAVYNRAEELIHTALMEKLAERLDPEVTVVFKDIMLLGKNTEQIWSVYEYFMHKKIYMAFMNGSGLDSRTILSLTGVMTPQIIKYIKAQISAYCQETERKQNMMLKLAEKSRQ